jgi:hypothetical protein
MKKVSINNKKTVKKIYKKTIFDSLIKVPKYNNTKRCRTKRDCGRRRHQNTSFDCVDGRCIMTKHSL